MGQISFTPAMVIGTWIEGIAYGVFLCLYLATLWLKRVSHERNAQSGEKSDGSFTAMFIISSVMFFIATLHMGLAGYRLAKVWIVGDNLAPPTASLTTMDTWDNTMWTILYVTQELLGTGAAVGYRFVHLESRKKSTELRKSYVDLSLLAHMAQKLESYRSSQPPTSRGNRSVARTLTNRVAET
ncbi:hypothetical protein AAF712_000329 [Marasmius tenuissimus]|uniref:Uncharacterized protein n=1 Tax=Marasmius tenuissimus TaxID=585030 RepID=A0ABR3AF90_9AGAR